MVIGGMFPLEMPGKTKAEERPNTIYAMSGRCAIYACLKDIGDIGNKVAYVPAYTCETVLSSYIKAGYRLKFYDVREEDMSPLFKEEDLEDVGVLNLCCYYGFSTYDKAIVRKCHEREIIILQDTTHSPTLIDDEADYAAGSLRKWMGIASGGVATKTSGPFSVKLMPAEKEHIEGRYKAMEERAKALETGDDSYNMAASETFWQTELRLRKMFDLYSSDKESIYIAEHFDWNNAIKKRRENFKTIISHLDTTRGWRPVFRNIGDNDVPSHFTLYADDREDFQRYMKEKKISSTVYWPLPPMIDDISSYPGAKYIYSHVCSIQLDQRYGKDEMMYLAETLNEYSDIN